MPTIPHASVPLNDFALTAGVPRAQVRRSAFPPSEFTRVPQVPVFAEHTTTCTAGRFAGKELTYDRDALAAITQRCNQRIRETGDYAMIVVGHTPPKDKIDAGEAPQPKVVGYAGPWTLGQMQTGERLRWVILADFWIFNEFYPQLKYYPRRSPEVWLEDSFAQMFLDPIALLGAEAPRLDMGMVYSRWDGGHQREFYCTELECYSGAVAPAAGNVFVQSHTGRYAGEDEPMPDVNAPGATPPDSPPSPTSGGGDDVIVKKVVDAIMSTAPFQFLMQLMSQQGAPGGQPPGGGPTPDAQPQPNAASDPNAMPPGPAAAPPAPAGPLPMPSPQPPMNPQQQYAGEDEYNDGDADNLARYEGDAVGGTKADGQAAAPGSVDNARSAPAAGAVAGSRENYQKLQQEVGDLRRQVQVERYARENAERRQTLMTLQTDEGIALNVDKEMQRLNATAMNTAGFKAQVEAIRENYQRMPSGELFIGGDFPTAGQRHKDHEAASRRAFEICNEKLSRGETPDYGSELANQLKAVG